MSEQELKELATRLWSELGMGAAGSVGLLLLNRLADAPNRPALPVTAAAMRLVADVLDEGGDATH